MQEDAPVKNCPFHTVIQFVCDHVDVVLQFTIKLSII